MIPRLGRRSLLVPLLGAASAILGLSASEAGHTRSAWALAIVSVLAAGASCWAAVKLLASFVLR